MKFFSLNFSEKVLFCSSAGEILESLLADTHHIFFYYINTFLLIFVFNELLIAAKR
jgi:hypothetical protein